MDSASAPESHDSSSGSPEPEVLKTRSDDGTPNVEADTTPNNQLKQGVNRNLHHRTYRPSHKATFIGLAAVIAILAINAGILIFVLKSNNKINNLANNQVTISPSVLNKVGVNTNTTGQSGVVLVVGPDAQFNGKVTVAGDVSIGGQLKLNSKLTASDASLTQLEAGNTALSQLNVNGSSTLSNLSLRNNLNVTGTTQLQGAVTINQLLTVNNSLAVEGNLAVGGVLSANTFSARNLTSTSSLTVEGHIITGGTTPGIGPGSAVGSNGTVSISGNDSAGTIAVNSGVGAGSGIVAQIAFRTQYGNMPRIVISTIGFSGNFYISSPSIGGFNISVSGSLPPGSYTIDYIVEQ